MEKYPKRLYVRMSAEDLEQARRQAESLDMTISDLVRVLLSVPKSTASDSASAGVLVVDRVTAMRIDRELNRWGHHYNQAVHALNIIAYYLRLDEMDAFDVLEQLDVANGRLQAVNDGAAALRRETMLLTGRHIARI